MEESGNVNQGSQGSPDISSPPDPTQAMPPFNEGKAVEGLSAEDARVEWEEITLDKNGKYRTWPDSVRLNRRDKLFDRGFAAKIEEDRKAQETKNREWLEGENQRLEERDEQEEINKARSTLVNYFGGEKEADSAVKAAKGIFKRFATEKDRAYVVENNLDNDPEFIQKLAEIDQIFKRGAYKKR
jgi:hypothetical protein